MIGKYYYIFSIALLISISGFSQQSNQAKLETKRKKLESDIAFSNKLLNETTHNKKATVSQLRLINSNINNRVDLLSTLKTSVYYIDNKIDDTESSLVKLNEELKNLKSKYIEIAWHAYKYKTAYNKLTFLFSADGINQAYQRMRYLDQISTYIRNEADRIKKVEVEKNILLGKLKKHNKSTYCF